MLVSVTIRDLPEPTRGELAARDLFWAQVRARVERAGARLTAEQILDARDADRS
jgi:hypothetical protein